MSLSVQQVSKKYGPVIALRSAGFAVAPGEVRALFGGNGSGKSTLAKIVSGSVQADAGSIEVDGKPVPPGSPKAAHAAGIAITFQELSLLPDLTVAENLSLERMPRVACLFRDERAIKADVHAVLERLNLAHLASLPVHALQVGEKYLVELAKALRLQPRYIVLDELTSALHEHEVVTVKRILREHRAEGGGAIVVSHRIAEIHELCDTITVLRNGEVVADGSLSEVSTEALVNWVGGTLGSSSEPRREDVRSASSRSVRVALQDVRLEAGEPPLSLQVREGEIVGLGGLPDQGQMAVLNSLFGLAEIRTPAAVMLDGARLNLRSSTDAVRAGIAYVSGDRDEVGFAIRSLRENMVASLISRGGSLALRTIDFSAALASLLTVYADLLQPLSSLSGGNQQKVLLARCFLLRPKVLLAADPTKGIDVGARAEVHAALRRLAEEQRTAIVFTSSDDRELAGLCDRVLVMERRRIVRELRAGMDLDEQTLIESYMRTGGTARSETLTVAG